MENPPFEDVFPIQDGDFPACYVWKYRRVIFRGVSTYGYGWLIRRKSKLQEMGKSRRLEFASFI